VLRNPSRRARYDAQRQAAQKPAEAPATGIAVPIRVRARRPPPAQDWLIRVGSVRSGRHGASDSRVPGACAPINL
jgi:hypothetical protein